MNKYASSTVAEVQAAQVEIAKRIYAMFGTPAYEEEVKNGLDAEYAETVTWLLLNLGRNVDASCIDLVQYEAYCNVYKSEHGIKPHGNTYAQMEVYMYTKRVAMKKYEMA